jgi:hypothetical protein
MTWGEGITHSLPERKNPRLCSKDVIHVYKDKNLAFLLNPIHGCFDEPFLWTVRGKPVVSDFGKAGCFKVTTVKKIRLPKWVNSKHKHFVRVQFAILCADAVLSFYESKYPEDKRPRKAIEAAKKYLKKPSARAAYAAAHAAAYAAADAAAYAAADAARAAYAAYAAADAARAAHAADAEIDFAKLADKAVKLIMCGDKP